MTWAFDFPSFAIGVIAMTIAWIVINRISHR